MYNKTEGMILALNQHHCYVPCFASMGIAKNIKVSKFEILWNVVELPPRQAKISIGAVSLNSRR